MSLDLSIFPWITDPAIREAVEDICLSLNTASPRSRLTEKEVGQTGYRSAEALQHDRVTGNNKIPFQRDPDTNRVFYKLRDLAMAMAAQKTNGDMPTERRETLKKNLEKPTTTAATA